MNQAPPLEVEHLQRLHEILDKGANDIDRIGAGAFLCAIYARARWSDLRYIHHIKYDGYKRNATMDLYTAEHKTSMTGLRMEPKSQNLSITSSSKIFYTCCRL